MYNKYVLESSDPKMDNKQYQKSTTLPIHFPVPLLNIDIKNKKYNRST